MAECRHPDIQRFGEIRCCLSCGEAVFDGADIESRIEPLQPSHYYQYNPLRRVLGREIRLIVLFAGEPKDDLCCDIITVNLADQPSYEAVSYTWADAQGDISLTSNIRCGNTAIAVTKNCEAALRRLRLQGRSRRLWVDAICIDQNDTDEKNEQVRLMSSIYSNAVQVLSYLGVGLDQARRLRPVIKFLQSNTQLPSHEPNRKELISLFLDLPYFDRVWIMQEVGLAQLVTLVIGEYEIRWTGDTISKILDLCSELDLKPPSVLRWTPSSRPEEENDILAVLCKSRNCSASDPRDKVYALLGLTNLSFSTQFPVDYSLTHVEVFTKLAIYCVEELGRFDILKHCQHVSGGRAWQNIRRIPTWVPQWDYRNVYEPLPPQFTETEKQSFATSWYMVPTKPSAWLRNELPFRLLMERITNDFTSDPDFYMVDSNPSTASCREQVRKWSEVQSVYDPESSLLGEDDEHLTQHIVHRESADFAYKISNRRVFDPEHHATVRQARRRGVLTTSLKLPYLKLRAHRLDSIVRRIGTIARHRFTDLPQTAWSAFGVLYCQVCSAPAQSGPEYRPSFWQQRRNFLDTMKTVGAGKTAFATEHSVGFTHGLLRTGDAVWALYGADVPFILREVDAHYELVGDCYLHRAGQPFLCEHCGHEAAPWPMQTEIIDIW
jgi:hypothetical protein